MQSVRADHGKEIDILAIHPRKRGKKRKVHVEVKVAINPVGGLRAWGPSKYAKDELSERVRLLCEHKFVGLVDKKTRERTNRCLEEAVERVFGPGGYEKWLVVGKMHRKDTVEDVEGELAKHGVRLRLLGTIVDELLEGVEDGVHMDDVGRYLQIVHELSTKDNPTP